MEPPHAGPNPTFAKQSLGGRKLNMHYETRVSHLAKQLNLAITHFTQFLKITVGMNSHESMIWLRAWRLPHVAVSSLNSAALSVRPKREFAILQTPAREFARAFFFYGSCFPFSQRPLAIGVGHRFHPLFTRTGSRSSDGGLLCAPAADHLALPCLPMAEDRVASGSGRLRNSMD